MGNVIEEIRDRMRKIVHVPVQMWKGWNQDDLLIGWFSAIGRFKTMFGAVLIMVLDCFILPCLLPLLLVMRSALTLIEAIVEQKMATQLYILQGYQRVNPIPYDDKDDAF
jgi:hypothetical protein